MSRAAPAWDGFALAAFKLGLGCALLARGFVAISDDDFSRTVIAEEFVHSPALDPSRTSWLPLPFWVHGGAMAIFGRSLGVAHATALMLGVASVLCVHRAALLLGASRLGAAFAALAAAAMPTAARLGVSTQPEAITAGLVLVGAATSTLDGRPRVVGALALAAASLCRYEAWAAAAAFATISTLDAARTRRSELALAAGIALLAPVAWVVHGSRFHGDALFFLHRVAAYRRALGATEPLTTSLFAYPVALLRREPEVTLSAMVALGVAASRAPRTLSVFGRPALVVGSTFVFLVVGRVLDGAPTHHAERTLLSVWMLLGVFAGAAVARWVTESVRAARSERLGRSALAALGVGAASFLSRAGTAAESYEQRAPERAVGSAARRLLSDGERLAVDTPDFGYFAVIAAFGAPERAVAVDAHDPRAPRPEDPFASETRLREFLSRAGARWLVAAGPHSALAGHVGDAVARAGELTLVRVADRLR